MDLILKMNHGWPMCTKILESSNIKKIGEEGSVRIHGWNLNL